MDSVLSFLNHFSQSFLFAMVLWPVLAIILTLPVLIIQYRRYNHLSITRVLGIYFFMLYALSLISFTLYPMPDDPISFCNSHFITPQLNPFTTISDIMSNEPGAILQVAMNIIFFIPLGFFAKVLFQWNIGKTIFLGFCVSLLIEIAQLTGAFGIYPCSYRLFDVDDLILNTFGTLVGFILGKLIPNYQLKVAGKNDVTLHPGALRRMVGFAVDMIIIVILQIFIHLVMYFTFGNSNLLTFNPFIFAIIFVFISALIPIINNGQTFGGSMVRATLDDVPRKWWAKIIMYGLRCGVLGLLVSHSFPVASVIMLLVIILVWMISKNTIYQLLTSGKNCKKTN